LQQQQLLLNTQRAAKLSTKNFFCSFFQQSLAVSKRNFTDIFSNPMHI